MPPTTSTKKIRKIVNPVDIWSGLPKELLDLILQRLPLVDQIRFGAVCTLWRSVRIDRPPQCPPQLPWLLIRCSSGENDAHISLNCLTMFDYFSYELHVEPFADVCSVGGDYGWLIMSTTNHKNFYLSNPVSKALVHLPFYQDGTSAYCPKVVLSSSPSSGYCIVAAMPCFGATSAVACRVGDKEWTIQILSGYSKDLIFHKGELYIMGDLEIEVFSCVSLPTCITKLRRVPLPPLIHPNPRAHLLNMGDDLLQFHVNGEFLENPIFCLFKLDKYGVQWDIIFSLGNQTVFVGWLHSIYISAAELIGTNLKKNSVYYHTSGGRIWRISVEDQDHEFVGRINSSCWYRPGL